ncbi:hypothetical protein BDY21DRAFT_310812 [Lineolata rhizophorae]|uniref:Mitochondrial adapter protein MCP1 transmembrane domain-containing protein n=1 Tax=Lineolata rhizophorae TaxID=578093 RepID=A0A6A6NNM8_9PEZI|nr:hypothetical protein BDY21DRAFT_310812 [Lineolata rhizophorae]
MASGSIDQARETRESIQDLEEVEPSPVEETPVDAETDDGYFPQSNSAKLPLHAKSSSLGLSGHNPVYYLSRLHRYSTYAFTPFVLIHLTSTSLIPLATRSIPTSDRLLLSFRPLYHSPIGEVALILAPIAVHVTTGILLRLHRRRATAARYGAESRAERRKLRWPKLSGTSKLGYMLIPLLAVHAGVNRGLPVLVEGGSENVGLGFVAHGFARFPVLSNVVYIGVVGLGIAHFAWGWARWLGKRPEYIVEGGVSGQKRRKRRWWAINMAWALLTGVWLAGGIAIVGRGGVAEGWIAREWDGLYGRIFTDWA